MTLPDANGRKEPSLPTKEKEIAVFDKNSVEKIIVKITEYQGQDYLDIRTWYNANGQDFIPTKKGITVSTQLVPGLLSALKKADKVLKEG